MCFRVFSFWLALFLIFQNSFSQDLSGISICIDPGHGKGNRNTGPTGLREANVNLGVALYWQDLLKAAHADTVLLTRTSDATNPTLSEREQFANRLGVTWFHSVHHNATGGVNNSARYTLILYEELANHQPQWPGQSDVMSNFMAQRIWQALHTSDWRVFGDFSFYGSPSYLGVLNDLQMPGELSEATFHDNPIEEAKLRNPDFLRLEARGLHTAFLDYFSAGTLPTGTISGIVRDKRNKKPVDGARVRLLPMDTTYVTDNWGNGLYVFHDLPPGSYRLEVAAEKYDSVYADVLVKKDKFTYFDFPLISSAPPKVLAVKPKPGEDGIGPFSKIYFKFSQPMNVNSVQSAFLIDPFVAGAITANSSRQVFTFEPDYRFEFGTTYQVEIAGSARDIYNHSMDGNGDGIGGDPYTLTFRIAPIDTSVPLVIDFHPPKNAENIFLREIPQVYFNQPIDPATVVLRQSLSVTSNRTRIVPLRIEYSPASFGEVLSLIPREPLRSDARYYITLHRSIGNSSGKGLLEEVKWSYDTEDNSGIWQEISTFRSPENIFENPLTRAETHGLLPDSLSMETVSNHFVSDSSALAVKLAFQDSTGQAFFAFQNQKLTLKSTDAASVAIHGDSSNVQFIFIFSDSLATFTKSFPINWHGWRTLAYVAERDSLQDKAGNAYFQTGPLKWRGFLVQSNHSLWAKFILDDIYLRKPENPVSITSSPELPRSFEVLPPHPNPLKNGDGFLHLRFKLERSEPVQIEIYDILGRKIWASRRTAYFAGWREFRWHALDASGNKVSPGIYFIYVQTPEQAIARKFVILP